MIITTSKSKKRAKEAKKFAWEKGYKFIPRGRKTFLELLKISKYYGETIAIFESKGVRYIKSKGKKWLEKRISTKEK